MPCWFFRWFIMMKAPAPILGPQIPMKPHIPVPLLFSQTVLLKGHLLSCAGPQKIVWHGKRTLTFEITSLDTLGQNRRLRMVFHWDQLRRYFKNLQDIFVKCISVGQEHQLWRGRTPTLFGERECVFKECLKWKY